MLKDVKHLARRPEDAVSLQNRAQASGLSRGAERDHLTWCNRQVVRDKGKVAGPRRPGGVRRRGDMIPVEFLQQATSKINQADAGTGIQTEAAFIYREKRQDI